MNRTYIAAVEPLDDHVLLIDFVSGSRLLLNVELSHDELLTMAETGL